MVNMLMINRFGENALILAATQDRPDLEIVEILLDKGAFINSTIA